MQELGIWLLVAIILGAFNMKLIDSVKGNDVMGLAPIVFGSVFLFIICAACRFIYLLIAAWF